MIANPNIKYLCLHHTASKNTGSKQLLPVNTYHQGKWNMKSSLGYYVGYNVFCDVDGKRTNTRKVGEETVANVGHNCDVASRCDTISYCMAGDFNVDFPTTEQTEDFKKYYQQVRKAYPEIEVVGHRHIQDDRTCPGANISDGYLEAIMGDVAEPDAEDLKKKLAITELKLAECEAKNKNLNILVSLYRKLFSFLKK